MKHLFLRHTRWITLIVLCVGMAVHADAQTFTQRIQKRVEGRGNVTVHHSQDIDRLVNQADGNRTTPGNSGVGPSAVQQNGKAEASKGRNETSAGGRGELQGGRNDARESEKNTEKGSESLRATAKTHTPEVEDATAADYTKKVMRNSHKVTGYRVQAFAGGNSRVDRQTAERTRNNIKAHFPHVAVYVHFYSPRWICRVGNYRTYEEAHEMLVNLQRLGYKQASIVKGNITVQY